MKTYPLNPSLKRFVQQSTIHFEDILYHNEWHIYDGDQLTDRITFKANNTLKVIKQNTSSKGHWKYLGGDFFKMSIEKNMEDMHLVHLDSNLIIFEVRDTKQYLILISPHAIQTLGLTSKYNIEFYLKKVREEVQAYANDPSLYHSCTPHIIPIMVMGSLYNPVFGSHDSDREHDHAKTKSEVENKLDEDEYSDEEIYADLLDEEPLMGLPEEVDSIEEDDESDYDNDDEDDNDYDDNNGYGEYGDFTEEEIIYDYLESQEEDDFLF